MSQEYSGSGLTSAPKPYPHVYRRNHSTVVCENVIYGCNKRFPTLGERVRHEAQCQFGPTTDTTTTGDDDMSGPQLKRNNSIKELLHSIDALKDVVSDLETKVNQQMIHLNDSKELLDSSPATAQTPPNECYSNGVNNHFNDDNELMRSEEVFESKPKIISKEELKRHSSNSSDVQSLDPEVTYKRFNSHISEEVEFGMYSSPKYKYLSQLTREESGVLPPIDYDLDQSVEMDPKKRNTSKLIDVVSDGDNCRPSLVRMRSWSDRKYDP